MGLSEFSFKYLSGGFWRKRDAPQGAKAETLHGDAAIERALLEQRTGSEQPVTLADPRLAEGHGPNDA